MPMPPPAPVVIAARMDAKCPVDSADTCAKRPADNGTDRPSPPAALVITFFGAAHESLGLSGQRGHGNSG